MKDAEVILREYFKLVDHLQAVVNEANKHRPDGLPRVCNVGEGCQNRRVDGTCVLGCAKVSAGHD